MISGGWAQFLIAAILATAAVSPGCGSSSGTSSTDFVAVCSQGCEKGTACLAGNVAPIPQLHEQCRERCVRNYGEVAMCTNLAEITSWTHGCLSQPCETYLACDDPVPACGRRADGGDGPSD